MRSLSRRGFTLIELLVVIAIIAILAAILFPVFASAREKARSSQCISNGRQLGSAIYQYLQDYDELMPLVWRNGPPRYSWVNLVQPYAKNYDLHRCPNLVDARSAAGESIWVARNPQNLAIWQGYGINVDYLGFAQNCTAASGWVSANRSGNPTPMAAIAQPAATVMLTGHALAPGTGSFAGSNSLYPVNGGEFRTFAPATLTTPEGCTFTNGGWGQGSLAGPYGGFEQPRHHDQGGTVIFVDGHAKFMTAGNLAAGTNWTVTTRNRDVVVTDRNRYLWDLQ